jgi:dipeptidyl aminopeptidase/acylaminoacyl peptidase
MGDGRTSRGRWVLWGLAVVAVLVVLLYAGASWFVYDQLGTAPGACNEKDVANTPDGFTTRDPLYQPIADANVMPAPEDVQFPSRDPGMGDGQLAGWWIPADEANAPAVVLVHGVKSCRREANILVPAGMLHRAGFSVLMMDLRDHGDSDGDDAKFAGGSEEYLDVLGAWDWVRDQGVPEDRIGLLGMSFGSINSIVAGGQEPGVRAVWADSAPPRMAEAIGLFLSDQIGDPTGISGALAPGAILWARLLSGDDLTRFDPIDQLDAYDGRNVAFVHGEKDTALPASFAAEMHDRAIAAGATTPDAWVVPGAKHTEGVYNDPAGYERRLVDFFTEALGQP